MGPIKRRKYLIDPSFQMGFIVKFCIIVIISSLLIGGVVFALTLSSTTVAIENTRVIVKSTSDFILPGLVLTVLVVSLFSALVMLVASLLITHRIAGPVFRFKKEIELVQQGDLSRRFGIRKKDHLQELAKSLGEMTASFRDKHIELNDAYRDILRFLQEKNYNVSGEDEQVLHQKLAKVEGALKDIKI